MYSIKDYLCWVVAFLACFSGIQAQEVRTIDGTENNIAILMGLVISSMKINQTQEEFPMLFSIRQN